MKRTLETLSYKKRAVLVLCEVEGWSCAEIGCSLGVPTNTIYTRLYHARREFKRAYERELRKESER